VASAQALRSHEAEAALVGQPATERISKGGGAARAMQPQSQNAFKKVSWPGAGLNTCLQMAVTG